MFVQVSDDKLSMLKTISGVSGLMYWKHTPAVISDEEIEMIRQFLHERKTVIVVRVPVNPGQHIIVESTVEGQNMPNIRLVLPALGFTLCADAESVWISLFQQVCTRTVFGAFRLSFH